MKISNVLTASVLMATLGSQTVMAADEKGAAMSESQKSEIQRVIHDYLVSNPDVLVEASQALQKKQQETMKNQAKAAIQQSGPQVFQDRLAVAGNLKGNVTLVEFFDYQCSHCKKMGPIIDSLVKKDGSVRVVYKEFPIFGGVSEFAAKAALAAAMQGKYKPMHDAIFQMKKDMDDKKVLEAATTLGLDMAKLKADMAGKDVTDALAANRQLAEKLHLMGTPAFIVAATPQGQFKSGTDISFIPGAASEEALQRLIKEISGA